MLLLYIDESGSFDSQTEHGVLGGLAIHAADILDFRTRVDGLLATHLDEHLRGLELHAQQIRRGGKAWWGVPQPVRHGLLEDLVRLAGSYTSEGGNPFALLAVARSPGAVPTADPLERAFEELAYRFESMLLRLSTEDRPEMGLIICDEARHEQVVQLMANRWREAGGQRRFQRLKPLAHLAEVPLFVDSKTTRLIQLADVIAHSVYQFYERGDRRWLGHLLPRFDIDGGVLHGLVHLHPRYKECPCPACVSRVARNRIRARRFQHFAQQMWLIGEEWDGPS